MKKLATPIALLLMGIQFGLLYTLPVVSAATSGPNSGGTFASDSSNGGTSAWTNTANAATSNDVDADNAMAALETTHYMKATNFSFDLPNDATIDGIVAEVERRHSSGSGCRGGVADSAVRIVKGGTIGSTNKTTATAWSSTDTYVSYGGASDLWGETWTVADIEASTFGFALAAVETDDDDCDLEIDHMRITVHYTGTAEAPDFGYIGPFWFAYHQSIA